MNITHVGAGRFRSERTHMRKLCFRCQADWHLCYICLYAFCTLDTSLWPGWSRYIIYNISGSLHSRTVDSSGSLRASPLSKHTGSRGDQPSKTWRNSMLLEGTMDAIIYNYNIYIYIYIIQDDKRSIILIILTLGQACPESQFQLIRRAIGGGG